LDDLFCTYGMYRALTLIFCKLIACSVLAQNWSITEVANLPEPVSNNAVCEGFSTEGIFIYSFAGIDSSLTYSGIHLKTWRMNTQTLQIEQLPDVPDTLGKVAAGASRVGNIIYVIGGYHVLANGNEISSNRVHRFDISQNQFISDGSPIPVPIDDHVQAVYQDSLIFVVTGWSNTGNVPDIQIYNTFTNTWQVGTSTPNSAVYTCFGASGEILGDTIYYFGGAGGFNFGAQSRLRKGYINPSNPTDISWSISESIPAFTAYRAAACKTASAVHWLGGSNVTYNFDAIAYNGSGLVQPANQTMFYVPNSGLLGKEESVQLPMDLRGVGNVSQTQKYLIGGITTNGTVSSSILKLDYEGTLSIQETQKYSNPFLSPNPTSNQVFSTVSGELEVFDSKGALVLSKEILKASVIEINSLQTGLYFAQLKNDKSIFRQRLIISQ
jgi:hypothetical protein